MEECVNDQRVHTNATTVATTSSDCFVRIVSPGKKAEYMSMALDVVALVAACVLALVLCFGGANVQPQNAYAEIYPANEATAGNPAAAQDPQASASAPSANGDSQDEAAEGESIEDEETPMSSGLGGGEPVASGFSFGPIAIVGIVAVAAFFFVLFRRLNGSISRMNNMFK